MKRRQVLLGTTTVLGGMTGCLSDLGGSDEPDFSEDIWIVVNNQMSQEVIVDLNIERSGKQFFTEEVTVPSESTSQVYPGITETGDYQFTVSVGEDRSTSFEWQVESFAIGAGSNMNIRVTDYEIQWFYEE